jgi:hypothetical protein
MRVIGQATSASACVAISGVIGRCCTRPSCSASILDQLVARGRCGPPPDEPDSDIGLQYFRQQCLMFGCQSLPDCSADQRYIATERLAILQHRLHMRLPELATVSVVVISPSKVPCDSASATLGQDVVSEIAPRASTRWKILTSNPSSSELSLQPEWRSEA